MEDVKIVTNKVELDTLIKNEKEKAVFEFAAKQKNALGGFSIVKKSVKGHDLETKQGRALAFVRAQRALAATKNSFESAAKLVKQWQSINKYDSDDAVIKVLGNGSLSPSALTDGGIFVTPDQYPEFIEILHSKSVIRQLPGVQYLNFRSGVLQIKKETGSGITTSWVGEQGAPTISKPSLGMDTMYAKKLVALCVMENDWLRRSDAGADQQILNIFMRDIAIAEDLAFIRSLGGAYTPKGLNGFIDSTHKFTMNATLNTANIKSDITKLRSLPEGADVNIESGAYIMTSRSKNYIGNVSSTNDINVYQSINDAQPTLNGDPVFISSQIPNTLGDGTESEIYYVDGAKIIIADAQTVNMTSSEHTDYVAADGSTVSAFQSDQTVFRLSLETDFYLKYSKAGAKMEGVKYI